MGLGTDHLGTSGKFPVSKEDVPLGEEPGLPGRDQPFSFS